MFGFMLGSYLAKIYVDIGSVDLGMGSLSIQYCMCVKVAQHADCVFGSSYPFSLLPLIDYTNIA